MADSFRGLPPSKRFKLLQQREPRDPCSLPPTGCLPAKKRIETHHSLDLPQQQLLLLQPPPTSRCLPAKKRVWAPHPLLGIEEYGNEEDEEDEEAVVEDSKFRGSMKPEDDEAAALAEAVPPRKELEAEEFEKPKLWSPTKPEDGKAAVAEAASPAKELEAEEETEETGKAAVEEKEEEGDGIVCAVCQSTDAHPLDPIVLCDGCDLMVHASCYGNPLIRSIPEGDWFCLRCEREAQEKVTYCCLCPGKGGATKPTTDGRWAHVLCALLVPEVFFHDPEGREGLDLSRIPDRRWAGTCCVCRSDSGCVVDCSEPRCGLAFHVSCGLEAEFCVEYMEGRGGGMVVGFCEAHTRLWRKQQTTGKFKFVPREQK